MYLYLHDGNTAIKTTPTIKIDLIAAVVIVKILIQTNYNICISCLVEINFYNLKLQKHKYVNKYKIKVAPPLPLSAKQVSCC